MDKVIIYTDGACSGNPGPGGWGSILMMGENRKALKLLKRPCKVDLYSDSAYVVNAFLQNWILGWIKNGWKNSSKEEVKNKELWQELFSLTKIHDVTFHKVKGHADNEYNNRCDELARNAIKNL